MPPMHKRLFFIYLLDLNPERRQAVAHSIDHARPHHSPQTAGTAGHCS